MKAFVTGGTGFVGRTLVDELLSRHWQVRVLARNPARAAVLPRNVTVIRGGLEDERALLEGARGADVVFHLAAATSGAWETHAEATVAGTRRMLSAAHEAGVRRLVLASSIVVYDKRGKSADSVLGETSPLLPAAPGAGAYARGKLEAEMLVSQYAGRDDATMEVVIVRPGLIYGADRLTFPHLGELVGQTRVAYGRPALLLPLVEVHSCADAIVRVATEPAAAGKTYNIVDACHVSRRDYLNALESITGHRQRAIYLPVGPVAAAGAATATLLRLAGSKRASDVSAKKIRSRAVEVRYDTGALQRDTGWRPLRELGQGLARSGLAVSRGPVRDIARAGIVGAGAIARIHLAALRRVPGIRVAGILDIDHAAARALAAEAGDVPAFDSADRFYEEARPQLVHVLTPPHTHAAVAREALRHNAHVLLEKPATTSTEECDALLAAADAAKLTVGVDETLAWDPLIQRARAALIYGILGELLHVEVFMGCDLNRGGRLDPILRDSEAWERRLPGGPLEDLLPHPLSVVRALCGTLALQHSQSMVTGRLPGDFPDELRLSLGNARVTARVGLSLSARPDECLVTVYGTRAMLRIDVQNMLFDCLTPVPGPRSVARGLRVVRSAMRMLGQTGRNGLFIAIGRTLPPASPIHLIRAHYAALGRGESPPAPLRRARADIAIARSVWPAGQSASAGFPDSRNAVAASDA